MKRAVSLILLVFGARAALAQSASAPFRVEVVAGLDLANLTFGRETDSRAGLVAGIGLVHSVDQTWSFQSELTYSMKGTAVDFGGGTIGTTELSYLELPVLVRYDVRTPHGVHPFVQAGPSFAVKVGCVDEQTNGRAGITSTSCDNVFTGVASFDVGAMAGAGIALDYGDQTVSLGVRYDYGLMEVVKDSDAKNRVLSIVATFGWP